MDFFIVLIITGAVAFFIIFIDVMWKIAKAQESMAKSMKEIAEILKSKSRDL
jgi:FtsZ-interacting cell division protein ZipA